MQYLLFRKATRVLNLKTEEVDRSLAAFGWHSNLSMVGELYAEDDPRHRAHRTLLQINTLHGTFRSESDRCHPILTRPRDFTTF